MNGFYYSTILNPFNERHVLAMEKDKIVSLTSYFEVMVCMTQYYIRPSGVEIIGFCVKYLEL